MAQQATFAGRYTRYKAGTEKVLDWLAKTASTCCDISSIVASLRASPSKRRISSGATVTLRTTELVRLALAIANADPRIPTPLSILETIRDVIQLRQNAATDYATDSLKRRSMLSTSDLSHQHFIAVLQQVHDILQPGAAAKTACVPSVKPNEGRNAVKKGLTAYQNTTNTFAKLQIEEPQSIGWPTPADAPPAQVPAVDYTQTVFRLDKKEEDANLALICHLQDLHDLRIAVREVWAQYSRGDTSLVYASMATEVALGLLRCADDQFTALNPQFSEYPDIMESLNVRLVNSPDYPGIMFILGKDERTPLKETIAGLDLPELLCPQAFSLLHHHTKYEHHIADRLEGSRTERPTAEKAMADSWCELHPFAKALRNNVNGIMLNSGADYRLNEFVAGLQNSFERGKIWIWLIVACQTYMDVFDILEGSDGVGVDDLKATLQSCLDLEEPVKAFFEKRTNHKYGGSNWSEWLSGVTDDVRKALRQIAMRKDAYLSGAVGAAEYTKQSKQFRSTSNRWTSGLECVLPTLAGGSVFLLKDVLLSTGCENANHPSLAVHSMAYLYKVGRRLGVISRDWPDMEFMIASQASVGPLVPKLPADCKLDRYLEAFKFTTGVRPNIDRRLNRTTITDVYSKGVPIKVGSEFCDKIGESIKSQQSGSFQTSMGKIVEIILHDIAHTNSHKKSLGKNVQQRAAGSHERESFSPVELLTAFKTSFLRDEPLLNFDYFGFMLHCYELSGKATDAITSSDTFTFDDKEVTSLNVKLPTVHLKEHPCSMAMGALLQLKIDLADPEVLKLSFWSEIAPVIERAIEQSGKRFLKAANDQSSGHIPKSLRPNIGKIHADRLKSNARKASPLVQAGTKVAFSGKLITLSHPDLTKDDLNNHGSVAAWGGMILPGYMVGDGSRGH